MARQILLLALVFFAVVGLASASASADAPTSEDGGGTIGNLDGDSDAAPVGGPVSEGDFPTTTTTTASGAPSPSAEGGAAALDVSAAAGVAAAVAAIFF